MKDFLVRNKKNIFNAVFLILIFSLTLYYVFHGTDGNLSDMWEKMQMADIRWLILAIICIVLFIYGESHIIHYMLKNFGITTRRFSCFLYSCVGFFFSCITPSATGGQPMQLYYMRKNKISLPVATVVLMIVTITYKAVLVAIGIWLVIFDRGFISDRLEGIHFVFYLGIFLNVFCVAGMMMLVFNQKLAKKIVVLTVKFLEKIHIMKHKEGRMERFDESMDTYARTAAYLKNHIPVMIKVFIITVLQRFAYFFVTFYIYKSFGLSGTGVYTIVMLQAVISLSVDMLPLPGGMGISEALFNIIFLPVFGQALLLPGMILSRSLSFYTELFLSAAFTIFAHIYIGRYTKKEAQQTMQDVQNMTEI